MLQKVIQKLISGRKPEFSYIQVAYKSKNGSWRAFAYPYDVSIEAANRDAALSALEEMVASYREGLKKYDYPSHLVNKHLSDEEDNERFNQMALDSLIQRGQIENSDFYAEAKILPA